AAAWSGAALSAVADRLPTGPVIVLAAFALFTLSLIFAPLRGALAAARRQRRFQHAVHRRQGLLAVARGEPIYERLTLSILRRAGLIQPDGVPTAAGRRAAARAAHDEARWAALRRREATNPGLLPTGAVADGLTPLDAILTPDQLAALDRDLAARVGPAPEPQP
ncbi:MAG: metal ABC transporter permease, partial [Pseudomonadota bacterium]